MQPDKTLPHRRSWMRIGFAIGVSVSLLAYLGIAGLLYLIRQFQLPEEELAIFTSLVYGIVFFLALAGVRSEGRRYKLLVTRNPYEAPPPPVSKSRETLGRIKTVLWYVFSLFSLGWLTPALVIYWADPQNPNGAVSICAYFFSLAVGTAYVLKRVEKYGTRYDYLILYAGLLLGAVLVDRTIVMVFL